MTDATDDGTAPHDRFCDIVMKGGITSGVVYPPAICKLAARYRFKNIGGTSAGAIAAALTAAAEYRRRKANSMAGFKYIEQLPETLGASDEQGRSQLLRLFQPDPQGRRLFRVLIASLNAAGTIRRIGAIVGGCVLAYWPTSLLSILVSVWLGMATSSVHGAILLFALTLPTFIGFMIYRDVTRKLVDNDYGLCKGMTTMPSAGPALTPWLHTLIQEVAGLPSDRPLTFGDLWGAPGAPFVSGEAPRGTRSIDLRMFTTNLSHGRPYVFPHTEATARLFYKPAELAAYLPEEVNRWLDENPRPYVPNRDHDLDAAAAGLREIPAPDRFPILLAARMSLSFPVLFSAVPLYAIDYEHPPKERAFHRCLFSDGGIASNFPVHMFDGLVPMWPTFGFDLEDPLPGFKDPDAPFLPHTCWGGIADRWNRFDQAQNSASRMGGFLLGIAKTMQNWNDNVLSRMAGVRDRVVRIRLAKDQGGMNLNMPKAVIEQVAARGSEAADLILQRFLDPAAAGQWQGWSFQRWVRLDVLIKALSEKTQGMARALGPDVPHSQAYDDLIRDSATTAAPCHDSPLQVRQEQALRDLKQALENLSNVYNLTAPAYPNEPLPDPDLRVRPPL